MAEGDRRSTTNPQSSQGIPSSASSLIHCPQCKELMAETLLEAHLRSRHHIYRFRGEQHSYNDLVQLLLEAICRSPSDPQAWSLLAEIAQEQYSSRSDHFLAASVSTTIDRYPEKAQRLVIPAVAESIARSSLRPEMATAFADCPVKVGRHLALLILGCLVDLQIRTDLSLWHRLVKDRDLPSKAQVAGLAALIRGESVASAEIELLLEGLTEGRPRSRSLALLEQLEGLAGSRSEIEQTKARLREQMRLRCGRCGIELQRPEMIRHLWEAHRLLLEGKQIREPWPLIEEWLTDAKENLSAGLLDRCQRLAQQLDPQGGTARLQRMLLASGIASSEARRSLMAEAKEKSGTLCPHCFGLIPIPQPEVGYPLNYHQGRLSANGYLLELSESALISRMVIESPKKKIYEGSAPGSLLTLQGALILFIGPVIILALLFALGVIDLSTGPLIPVVVLLFVGFVFFLGIWEKWKPTVPLKDRIVDLAWLRMAAPFQKERFSLSHSEWIARLALFSADKGQPALRAEVLNRWIPLVRSQIRAHAKIASHLAALQRLAVSDALAVGDNPIDRVVDELASALEGKLPLAYAEALLFDWKTDWWTKANLAQLKVMVCDRAFESGFEVKYLLEIGQAYPALGSILEIEEPEHLAYLRLLWSLRPSRPWDQYGSAETVFDLIEDGQSELLAEYPDLLLMLEDPRTEVSHLPGGGVKLNEGPLQLLVLSRGVVLQGFLFEEMPTVIESVTRKMMFQNGYDVTIDGERFRFSREPSLVSRRLERWFRYIFREFFSQVRQVYSWHSPDQAALLRSRGALPCPSCKKPVLPRLGKVARRVDKD